MRVSLSEEPEGWTTTELMESAKHPIIDLAAEKVFELVRRCKGNGEEVGPMQSLELVVQEKLSKKEAELKNTGSGWNMQIGKTWHPTEKEIISQLWGYRSQDWPEHVHLCFDSLRKKIVLMINHPVQLEPGCQRPFQFAHAHSDRGLPHNR